MHRPVFSFVLFLVAVVLSSTTVGAQTLHWDHSAPSTVSGYIVSIDGVRTDHGLNVAGAGGACGCSLTVNLSAGTHRLIVSAYNESGETASAPLSIDVAGTPPPPPPPPPPPSPTVPAPWLTQDIGSVGVTGSASIDAGRYLVAGAGVDIWGAADAFRYLYRPLSGNGTIVARVTGMQNTNTFAKAGIMIRETTQAGSSHALLNLRPNGAIEFLSRNGAGTGTRVSGTTTQPAPAWVRLTRDGDTIRAAVSSDGQTWSAVGTTTVTMGANVLVGLAVCSVANGTLNTATFDGVSVSTSAVPAPPPPAPGPGGGSGTAVPLPWSSDDVGNTGLSGSASHANGTFTVTGAGADVWGTADGLHFVHQPFAGDGSFTTRVVSLENTGTFAKAGLMLRGSLEASAQNVVLNVRPNGSVEFMSRRNAGGSTTFLASAGQTPPAWLRLTRSGRTVRALVSRDGSSWTTIGSVTVDGLAYGGLFVSSHDVSTRNTAVFDAVSAPASAGGPSNEIVIYAADLPGSALHGWSLVPSASGAANMKLTTANTGVAHASSPLGGPATYVDVTFTAAANTPYALWLRLRATDNNKYNDSVWVQFSDARVDGAGRYAIGSTSGLLVNLSTDSTGASLREWGWQNGAYWFAQPATVTFGSTGAHTLRIQIREDGVQLDQIVLSPSRYLTQAPGAVSGDSTIVTR